MEGIKDKVVIVTGAGRNIGQVYSRRLGEEGAKVVVCDVIDCEETAGIVRAQGAEVLALHVDVTDEAQTQEMARRTVEHFGRIDGLVNNAALFQDLRSDQIGGFMDIDMDRWDRVYSVNVRGTFLCMRAVFPYMREGGGGKIVNVASRAAFRGEAPDQMPYGASKGALVTLTKTIARGFARDGILAFAIAPGFTETDMATESLDDKAIERVVSQIPLGRMAAPEEIGDLAAFLCSDSVRHLTGATFDVNGASYLR